MEFLAEKLTELGVSSWVLIDTEYSQKKKNQDPVEKLKRVSLQALKQCERLHALEITGPKSLREYLEPRDGHGVEFADDAPVFVALERISNALGSNAEVVPNAERVTDQPKKLSQSLVEALKTRQSVQTIRILLGPEGGFSESEKRDLLGSVRERVMPFGLGSAILRAETAAIVSVGIVREAMDWSP
jgi:RsmE family RNA methyltransferase